MPDLIIMKSLLSINFFFVIMKSLLSIKFVFVFVFLSGKFGCKGRIFSTEFGSLVCRPRLVLSSHCPVARDTNVKAKSRGKYAMLAAKFATISSGAIGGKWQNWLR